MKYLKRIFESMISSQDVQDFCDNYLVYLLDTAEFVVYVKDYPDSFVIWLQKTEEDPYSSHRNYCSFTWDEIKDQYIPFILMLSKTYKLDGVKLNNGRSIFINLEEKGTGTTKKREDQIQLTVDEIESFSVQKRIDEVGVIINNEKI
jgi:hypothetical protein